MEYMPRDVESLMVCWWVEVEGRATEQYQHRLEDSRARDRAVWFANLDAESAEACLVAGYKQVLIVLWEEETKRRDLYWRRLLCSCPRHHIRSQCDEETPGEDA